MGEYKSRSMDFLCFSQSSHSLPTSLDGIEDQPAVQNPSMLIDE